MNGFIRRQLLWPVGQVNCRLIGLYARWPYGQEFITIFVDFNIVRIYPTDHPDFDAVLKKSGETIKLAKQRERSPWERW